MARNKKLYKNVQISIQNQLTFQEVGWHFPSMVL